MPEFYAKAARSLVVAAARRVGNGRVTAFPQGWHSNAVLDTLRVSPR
jgi:hypothetical protein